MYLVAAYHCLKTSWESRCRTFRDLLLNNTKAYGMLTWSSRNIWYLWKKIYFWNKLLFRQIIREAMNYFETGNLAYPGAWRIFFWNQHVAVSMIFQIVLACLFDIINCYLFIFKRNASLGPSREYFLVVGFGSVFSFCTNFSFFEPFFSPSRNI